MVNPRQEKIEMKNAIMQAVMRDGQAKQEVIVSSLKLETGFSEAVIADIMKDLKNVGLIEIKDGIITATEKGKKILVTR